MTPPYVRKWRGTKEPLDEIEKGQWKSWLKTQHSKNEDHGIWSHHLIANRWGNNGKVTAFIFLSSKITAYGDYSHEILRHLLLGRKTTTNIERVLKSREITLLTMICIVKSMIFPVIMYKYNIWTRKKAECGRTDTFKFGILEKTLESPVDCK